MELIYAETTGQNDGYTDQASLKMLYESCFQVNWKTQFRWEHFLSGHLNIHDNELCCLMHESLSL